MKINNSIDFGKAIKLQRKALGYTQERVAMVTGFSASFISDLERGKKTSELDKAIHLANVLGLDVFVNER